MHSYYVNYIVQKNKNLTRMNRDFLLLGNPIKLKELSIKDVNSFGKFAKNRYDIVILSVSNFPSQKINSDNRLYTKQDESIICADLLKHILKNKNLIYSTTICHIFKTSVVRLSKFHEYS